MQGSSRNNRNEANLYLNSLCGITSATVHEDLLSPAWTVLLAAKCEYCAACIH